MKKTGLLNQPISTVIAGLGHMDTLVIADAGLPIPSGVTRIDLAVTAGLPSFVDVLRSVLGEMQVQSAVIAQEMDVRSPQILRDIEELLPGTPVERVSHEQFKQMTRGAVAVIRTGECTPYANIILTAGVIF